MISEPGPAEPLDAWQTHKYSARTSSGLEESMIPSETPSSPLFSDLLQKTAPSPNVARPEGILGLTRNTISVAIATVFSDPAAARAATTADLHRPRTTRLQHHNIDVDGSWVLRGN